MRPDGSFMALERRTAPLSLKVMIGAVLVAVVAGAMAFAALALWVFSMVLPVLIGAGLVAWGTMKFRRWQAGRRGGTLRPL